MPLKNGVIQGYLLVKPVPQPLLNFHGRPNVTIFNLLSLYTKRPYRYENLRLIVLWWSFIIGMQLGNSAQRKLKDEWEKNMRIQRKLHPVGVWDETLANAAAEKLGRKKPAHHLREFEGGYQLLDLKPKIKDEDEHH
jgi:hypothetical protein